MTSRYLEGAQAADTDGMSITDNPYTPNTVAFEAWHQGFMDAANDEVEDEHEEPEGALEGCDIMETY